ncbi:hypothetical protein ABZ922_31365 [Streptomyces shenzhenensis]
MSGPALDLGGYVASCVGLLTTTGISSHDDALDTLDDMLDRFSNS